MCRLAMWMDRLRILDRDCVGGTVTYIRLKRGAFHIGDVSFGSRGEPYVMGGVAGAGQGK